MNYINNKEEIRNFEKYWDSQFFKAKTNDDFIDCCVFFDEALDNLLPLYKKSYKKFLKMVLKHLKNDDFVYSMIYAKSENL